MAQIFGRDPIWTYQQALNRLFTYWVDDPLLFAVDRPMPLIGLFVCDLYWVTERELRSDLAKISVELFHSSNLGPPRPKRRGEAWHRF